MSAIAVREAGSRLVHTPPATRDASAPVARGVRLGILALVAVFVVAIVAGVMASHPAVVIASGLAGVLIVPFIVASYVNDAMGK
ncbi:MAG: hypothetical protein LKI58_01245 [Actinomyces sp.]|jgi:hypothetical protein|nr:hypothetical protein [Actinomyces sp.]MCI1786683.1 hypothetical protein [Actinomyces sp.]MCI1830747.1 hypothetical protein [Actinomyces sp.]